MASKTSKTIIETTERRLFELNLRRGGANYRTIAEQTIERFGKKNLPKGYDERYAYKDVKRELDKRYKELRETVEEYRTLELERLDRLMIIAYNIAITEGDQLDGIKSVLSIQRQVERYIPGLRVPEVTQIEGVPDGRPIVTKVIVHASADDHE